MALIQAIAHRNELTKDEDNDFYLTPQMKEALTLADVVKSLADREIATKNVNGLAFTEQVFSEIVRLILEGYTVNTPLFHASLSLKGTVMSEELGSPIAASRLNISFNFTQGELPRKALQNVSVEVFEQSGATGPVIQNIIDPTEGQSAHINPGSMVLIEGKRLALKGDDESVGILFTSVMTPDKSVFISPSKVSPNSPSKLQFILPAEVNEGPWMVTVTTQAGGNSASLIKVPRTSNAFRIMNGSAV